MKKLLLGMALLALLVSPALLRPRAAAAHPLGNFTVNRYSRLELMPGSVRIRYVLDMAEIPTFQEMSAIDTDRNGAVSDAENAAYRDKLAGDILRNLTLSAGGRPVALSAAEKELSFPPGQGGLDTLRFSAWYEGVLPAGSAAAEYHDLNYRDRLGWKEIVVRGGPGIAVSGSTASAEDQSDELRAYPDNMLKSPLDQRDVRFDFAPGQGADLTTRVHTTAEALGRKQDRFTALITRKLTVPVVLLSLLLAMGLGALHALGPGHGKTVVAAYLVGSRGTTRHAIFLGLTVTITHTSSVFALGLVTLYLSEYILPEQLFPWLSFLSGAGIAVLGAVLLVTRGRTALRGRSGRRLGFGAAATAVSTPGASLGAAEEHSRMRFYTPEREHGHSGLRHSHGGSTHSHVPPGANGERVSTRNLLALGISGGILPCPSALVVLLTAISIHRIGYGMLLIVAFSVGLAGVLVLIGLLLVHARGLFRRLPVDGLFARIAPVISAAVVMVLGTTIAVRAILQNGKLTL